MKLNKYFQLVTIFLSTIAAKRLFEKPAKEGQFPFMAQIVRILATNATSSMLGNIYGGSLITPTWVLTSGQCFPWLEAVSNEIAKNKSMLVIMGSIKNVDFSNATSTRFIVKIVRHPDFQHFITGEMESVSDDIAVAKVESKFILDTHIQTVSLSAPSVLMKEEEILRDNYSCNVMGFGGFAEDTGVYLTYSEVKLISSLKFRIPKTANVYISASKPDDVVNHGDIGSPVVCNQIQYGIVSALVEIDNSYVDMYTEVGRYKEFIDKHVSGVIFRSPLQDKFSKKSAADIHRGTYYFFDKFCSIIVTMLVSVTSIFFVCTY